MITDTYFQGVGKVVSIQRKITYEGDHIRRGLGTL